MKKIRLYKDKNNKAERARVRKEARVARELEARYADALRQEAVKRDRRFEERVNSEWCFDEEEE